MVEQEGIGQQMAPAPKGRRRFLMGRQLARTSQDRFTRNWFGEMISRMTPEEESNIAARTRYESPLNRDLKLGAAPHTSTRVREGMPAKGRVLRRPRLRCRQKPQHPPQPQHSLDRVLHMLRLLRLSPKQREGSGSKPPQSRS